MSEKFHRALSEAALRMSEIPSADFASTKAVLTEAKVKSFRALIRTLRDAEGDRELRVTCCYVTGCLRSEALVGSLVAVFEDPRTDLMLRWEAAKAIALIGGRRAARPLIAVLQGTGELEQRKAAAYALRYTEDPRAAKPLLAIVESTSEEMGLRETAAEALAGFTDQQTVDGLIRTLNDPMPIMRFWAAYSLGQIGDPRAVPELARLKRDKSEVPFWWSVGKEAKDAIQQIEMRSEWEG